MARSLPVAHGRSGEEIDKIALAIIRRFQPEVLLEPSSFDVETFFDCDLENLTGVSIDYLDLPFECHGYTDIGERVSVISTNLYGPDSNPRFRRSTVAHESGHARIHVPEFRARKARIKLIHNNEQASLKLYREELIPVYKNPEWQAWRFAGALLMPSETVIPAVKEGMGVLEMAEAYDVHPAFVFTRLKALKLTPEKL